MKVVFMGTPDFASLALQAIIDAGHEVVAVVTQPDKEKGRGKEVQCSPVKECAVKNNIPVFQPVKVKEENAVETLRECGADIFVVAAFGQILSKEILSMPKFGCVNIHASLLPKYRGAAPIQWSILDGEKETGITIMQMDEGVDTGDILLQEKVSITDEDTGASLFDKLAVCGASLIVKALPLIEKGEITPVKQDENKSCYAKMLKKEMGLLDFSMDAQTLSRKVRGLNSWPSAYTYYNGKTMKIWQAVSCNLQNEWKKEAVGTIVSIDKDSFTVLTSDGGLKVAQVQLEGKKKMDVSAFLLGYKMEVGQRFSVSKESDR